MLKIFNIVLLVVLITILNNSCKTSGNEKQQSKLKSQIITVDATIIKPISLNHQYLFTGSILANEQVEIRTEISGRVDGIFFKEGTKITKGSILVKIYDKDLQAQLKKISLTIELAETDEKRKNELLKLNGISKEEYDISLNKLKTLQAEKEYIQAQISKTEIRAPFDGTIGLRMISDGAYLSPSTLITTIQQLNPLKIEFAVSEKFANKLNNGDKFTFSVSGHSENYTAQIYAKEPRIDENTRTFRVRALCGNPDQSILPGSFANIHISPAQKEATYIVPSKAIIPVIDGESVFIIRNGKAKSQMVETGLRTENEVEITKGLQTNDTVILSALLQLKSGTSVNAIIVNQDEKSELNLSK